MYFQPITVLAPQTTSSRANASATNPVDLSRCSEKLQDILIRSRQPVVRRNTTSPSKARAVSSTTSVQSSKLGSDAQSTISAARTTSFEFAQPTTSSIANALPKRATKSATTLTRSKSMPSAKSRGVARAQTHTQTRQVTRLDRRAVADGASTEEDLKWIRGLDATGSLDYAMTQQHETETIMTSPRSVPATGATPRSRAGSKATTNSAMRSASDVTASKDASRKGSADWRDRIRKGSALSSTSADVIPRAKIPSPDLDIQGRPCDRPTELSQAVVRARNNQQPRPTNKLFPKAPNNSGVFTELTENSFVSIHDATNPQSEYLPRAKGTGALNYLTSSMKMSSYAQFKKMPFVKFSPEYRVRQTSTKITVK